VKAFSFSFLLFSCSSLIVLRIIVSDVNMSVIVQGIAFLLVLALITVHIFDHTLARKEVRWFLLFLTSCIVQLLVASTGGLSSPFFILFHLTAFSLIGVQQLRLRVFASSLPLFLRDWAHC
jgi:hypothetical protein